MRPSKKVEQHERLAAAVDAWIAKNGMPEVVDHTANKSWRERKLTPQERVREDFTIRQQKESSDAGQSD